MNVQSTSLIECDFRVERACGTANRENNAFNCGRYDMRVTQWILYDFTHIDTTKVYSDNNVFIKNFIVFMA